MEQRRPKSGDVIRNRAGVTARVECCLDSWAVQATVLANPSHDGRWPVGLQATFLTDEVTILGGFDAEPPEGQYNGVLQVRPIDWWLHEPENRNGGET